MSRLSAIKVKMSFGDKLLEKIELEPLTEKKRIIQKRKLESVV